MPYPSHLGYNRAVRAASWLHRDSQHASSYTAFILSTERLVLNSTKEIRDDALQWTIH